MGKNPLDPLLPLYHNFYTLEPQILQKELPEDPMEGGEPDVPTIQSGGGVTR